MNRATFQLDRFLTIVLALALLLGGLWVLAWAADLLPAGWWSPSGFRLGLAESVADTEWWPWALLGGGLLLALLGLWWFGSHFRANGVGQLAIPGSAQEGRLRVDSSALASGAAAALTESSSGVASATGRVVEEGRSLVLDLTATVRTDADLREVAKACDAVSAQAAAVSGREDLTCRVRLKVAPGAKAAPRVR